MSDIEHFLNRIRNGEHVSFAETQSLIACNYQYTPVRFATGLGSDRVENEAGNNEGSCKILSFAKLQHLDPNATLRLFGDYYWVDVLRHPEAENHRNLRNLMRYGWEGVVFSAPALSPLKPE